ncbi:MAG TPA: acetate--CoA ligase family protein [Methanosarcina sp.]
MPEQRISTYWIEAFDILKAYGIPVVKTVFAKTVEEAVSAAKDIGYPLVMEVVSPQISHKSDIGGIRFPLLNASDVKAAYQDIMEIILEAVLKFKSLLQ